jgi:hypothetical protein
MRPKLMDSEVPVRATTGADGGRRQKTFPSDRVCSHPQCETRLSMYNARTECWQHEPVRPYVIRLGRRRKDDGEARAVVA